jgi:predicted metal-dependent peptidase
MDRTEIDALATERVLKARSELILSRRFYGVLVTNTTPVLSRKHATLATDSVHHFYNPDYVATLDQDELLTVIAEETEHDARQHSSRRAGRDPKRWNKSCDYSIMCDLKAEGFKLPADSFYDPRFAGMSAEDIYRTLELEEQAQQQQQQEDDNAGDAGDDAEEDGARSAEDAIDNGDQQTEADDEADASEDDGDASGEGAGDDASDGEDAGASSGGADGDGDAAGDDATGGNSDRGDAEAGEADGDAAGEDGGEGEGVPNTSGKRVSCGEVIDAPEPELGEAPAPNWERIMRQAASISRGVGQLPAHVAREIEASNNRPQDWREQLRAFFDQGAERIETWNRPNKRFIGRGVMLPGSQRDGINKVVIINDVSGSVDDIAQAMVRDEVQAVMDEGILNELVVIYCDTQVIRVDEYAAGDDIEFASIRGGGTDMRPAYRYVEEHHSDATLIINFTDLLIGDPGPMPSVPVLFAVFGYPQMVKALMAATPWEAPAIDVGAH